MNDFSFKEEQLNYLVKRVNHLEEKLERYSSTNENLALEIRFLKQTKENKSSELNDFWKNIGTVVSGIISGLGIAGAGIGYLLFQILERKK